MPALRMFIPLVKIDAAQRLVYGVATAEKIDRSGEVCDYESTKPFYEKWSGDIHKTTDGKSLGNVRAMHGKVAAGKVTSLNFNDAEKQIEICAKVVDDAEWKKVEEGVYTGFSQGGSYVKRWKGDDGVQRYTADPHEVSLVDLPCLPESTFEVIKTDGAHELRKFVSVVDVVQPSNDDVAAKAREIAKAAGDETKWMDQIEVARADLAKVALPEPEPLAPIEPPKVETPIEGEVEQVWKARDGQLFKKKADALEHNARADAEKAAKAASGPIEDKLGAIEASLGINKVEEPKPAAALVKAAFVDDLCSKFKASAAAKDLVAAGAALAKGLYSVGRLASLLSELDWLQSDISFEALLEADASTAPEQLKAVIGQLAGVLRVLVTEETAELMVGTDVDVVEAAAGLPVDHLDALRKLASTDEAFAKVKDKVEKAGARNSKSDKANLQAAHDAIVAAGGECATEKTAQTGDLAKVADELQKATTALAAKTIEAEELQKRYDALGPRLDEVTKIIAVMAAQPAQGIPARTRAVGKAEDGAIDLGNPEATIEKLLQDPDSLAMLAIKMSQRNGQTMSPAAR